MAIGRVISTTLAAAAFQALTILGGDCSAATTESSAVVFVYGQIVDENSPSGGVRVDQFEAHLEELTDDVYTPTSLGDVAAALKSGAPLPDRAIALSFDDATRSFMDNAFPRLVRADLPFTLFVATDPVDRGSPDHMSWAELRKVAAASGATIGLLGATTASGAARPVAEVMDDVRRAEERIFAELGIKPKLFAYPQGEYTAALRAAIADRGYAAAFGLHSGVISAGGDRMTLPRFAMTETYGGIERFRTAANALPLPVSDVTPEDPVIRVNPPAIGFTVDSSVGDSSRLACFISGVGRTEIERVSDDRMELRIDSALPSGRSRVNCTLPGPDGRWRWFGLQYIIPDAL